jgi:hypothetical protein
MAAAICRMLIAYGHRIGNDPSALAYIPAIDAIRTAAINMGIAEANRRPDSPYSLAEIAAITGVSRQAVHKRVKLGERFLERVALGKVVRLADLRTARAAALQAAGLEDRTGTPRELTASEG